MGMDRAKSLLRVRGDQTFLDIIAGQVLAARAATGARLPLVLMNSFRTQRRHPPGARRLPRPAPSTALPLDFVQNREPKLRADDLTPVEWPATRTSSGARRATATSTPRCRRPACSQALLDAGFRYATVSNSDNLGAAPDARIAGWFAASGAPFAAEVARRTPADRKGGHLVVRRRTAGSSCARPRRRCPRTPTPPATSDAPVLQHEQPLARPGGAGGGARPHGRRARPAADPQREDGRPERQVVDEGRPDRVGHGCGDRGVRRRRGARGRPLALPAGQDDERPARAALGRVRARGRLPAARPASRRRSSTSTRAHYALIATFDARIPHAPSLAGATSLRVRGDWTFGRRRRRGGRRRAERPRGACGRARRRTCAGSTHRHRLDRRSPTSRLPGDGASPERHALCRLGGGDAPSPPSPHQRAGLTTGTTACWSPWCRSAAPAQLPPRWSR